MPAPLCKTKFVGLIAAVLATVFLSGCSKMSETIRDEDAGMNGSFEWTKSGLPVNWLLYTPNTVPTGDFDLIIDQTEVKAGKQSLKFVVRECAATGGWHSPGLCKQYPALPGETYRVSFWIKNEGCTFSARIGGVSPFEGEYETIVRSRESTNTWKQFEHDYQMPTGKKFNEIRFEMNVLHPGRLWMDDIRIEGPDGKSVQPAAR